MNSNRTQTQVSSGELLFTIIRKCSLKKQTYENKKCIISGKQYILYYSMEFLLKQAMKSMKREVVFQDVERLR